MSCPFLLVFLTHAQSLFPQMFLLILLVVAFHFAFIFPFDIISTKLISRFRCNCFFPDVSQFNKLVSCRKVAEIDAVYFILLSQRWAMLIYKTKQNKSICRFVKISDVTFVCKPGSCVIFTCCILYSRPYLKEIFCHYRSAAVGVTRSRSLKKTLNTSTAIKKNSHCLQLIYQVVSGLFLIFIHSFLYRSRLDPHSRFIGYSLFESCPHKISQNSFTWLFFSHRTPFWTLSERPRSISFAAFYPWILLARWTAVTLSWEIRLGKICRH